MLLILALTSITISRRTSGKAFLSCSRRVVSELICSHKRLEFERVNQHGLLFTWRGKIASLKPIVRVYRTLPLTKDLDGSPRRCARILQF